MRKHIQSSRGRLFGNIWEDCFDSETSAHYKIAGSKSGKESFCKGVPDVHLLDQPIECSSEVLEMKKCSEYSYDKS